ncbi:MAG: c-type cytochrome [Flavisolibacter sp.]|nr:c-type cytochrome [Flavisolibacter sp.]
MMSNRIPVILCLICLFIFFTEVLDTDKKPMIKPASSFDRRTEEWTPLNMDELPFNDSGNQIRYGSDLITNTSFYLGPKGRVTQISNGMNCQNCHLSGGTRLSGYNFAAVSSTYPRFRERSGITESIAFRINACLQRSLNGKKLDSSNYEMQSMVSYLKWLGTGVPKGARPRSAGARTLPFMERAADSARGRIIFLNKCQRCHLENGQGLMSQDSTSYIYPPLWGPASYNTASGMYRIGLLAGFIKNYMPYDFSAPDQLTDEAAWDVAAFISSQPRPEKYFEQDWPDPSIKPVDHPFGPYADGFNESQHKYGPFKPIMEARRKQKEKK